MVSISQEKIKNITRMQDQMWIEAQFVIKIKIETTGKPKENY